MMGDGGRRGLSREMHKTTPCSLGQGLVVGCRRSQSSPPKDRISSRAVHGRPKEPGECDVATTVPRPGAIDKCAISSVSRPLMVLSSQLDWCRHEDKRTGCVLLVRLGWSALDEGQESRL